MSTHKTKDRATRTPQNPAIFTTNLQTETLIDKMWLCDAPYV